MSRETDSSSSGPEGRGGSAYPSGTPPYGPPQYPTQDAASNNGSGADTSATDPANPRTETQLTTKISINIPGSRPIPPVVVRKPVEESGDKTARDNEAASGPSSSAAPSGVPQQRTEPPAPPARQERPARDAGRTSSWFAPRRPPAPPPSSDAGPGAAGSGGASEPSARTEPPKPGGAGGPSGAGGASGPGTPRSGLPYFSGTPGGSPSPAADRSDHQRDGAADSGPSGPTTGPASGDGPGMMPGESLLPPAFQRGFNSNPAAEKTPQAEPHPAEPHPAEAEDGEGAARPRHARPNPLEERRPGGVDARRPGGLGEGRTPAPGAGAPNGLGAGSPTGLRADDLAGPRLGSEPAAEPPGPHVSGDTLVSGVPVVGDGSRRSGAGSSGRRSGASGRGEGGGRSRTVLVGGAVLGVLGIAYGAGLLLDHADVPKGTTVLGVDIGGMSQAAAAQKLDNALGERTRAMTVTIDGEQHQLQPDKAGLGVKAEATVREAAGRDYNPVTVIGSLFGGTHEADPVYGVDKEKLTAALKTVSGEASGALDGTIKFVPGRAIPVPGKPHEALDIGKSVPAVADAFRKQAATGKSDPVALPSSMRKPAVSNAEIQRKMRTFAQPAMSGLVTVKAGSAVIQFGPDKSLPKILSMRVVGGKLVEHYNLRAVKQLYGSTFDGVLIRRGNGSKTPVTPQDVVNAMGPALLKTDPAQRVGIIPLNGN